LRIPVKKICKKSFLVLYSTNDVKKNNKSQVSDTVPHSVDRLKPQLNKAARAKKLKETFNIIITNTDDAERQQYFESRNSVEQVTTMDLNFANDNKVNELMSFSQQEFRPED
jgi:hypothetical protein